MSLYSALAQNERGFKLLIVGLVLVTAGSVFFVMEQQQGMWRHWLLLGPDTTGQGAFVFHTKGCDHCHSVAGMGGNSAPDFALSGPQHARLPQLVIAMWNHIPRMRERMQAEKVAYPKLTYNETAQLFSFFYSLSRLDQVGDPERGRLVFERQGCAVCHSIAGKGGTSAKDLSKILHPDKIAWAQSMLTSAPKMYSEMSRMGMSWPQFKHPQLNDLLTYLMQASDHISPHPSLVTGDADAGWQVYQSESCLVCHSVKSEQLGIAPSLGASTQLPATATGIAAVMWNKLPLMQHAIDRRQLADFSFQRHELSDLIAFIQSLRYFEPTGTPQLGQTVFLARGCAACHGDGAEGTKFARALRGNGQIYNSISLATALWSHGGDMYRQSQKMGLPWPTLQESDVGDLLAFLNTPVAGKGEATPLAATPAPR